MSEPNKDLAVVTPQPVTAGYALTFVSALAVLGVVSTAWLVFLVIATAQLVAGVSAVPAMIVGGTGALLFRAWRAMAQTFRHRLHPPAVEDYDALPPSFGMMSAGLQGLVVATRTTRAVIAEPEFSQAEVLRAMFDWLMTVQALQGDDVRDLRDRGFTVEGLRSELKALSSSAQASRDADVLLARVEANVLQQAVDPFR